MVDFRLIHIRKIYLQLLLLKTLHHLKIMELYNLISNLVIMILLLNISLLVNVINILNTLLIIFILNFCFIIVILNISYYHKKIFLAYIRHFFFQLDCLIKQMLPIRQLLLVLNLKSLLMVMIILLKIILDHFELFIHLMVEVLKS